MPIRYLVAPMFLVALISTTACVDDPQTVAGCSPVGSTNTCTCSDNRTGSQTCQEDLSYSSCVCQGGNGDAGNGGDTGNTEDAGNGEDEIVHVNLNEGDGPWSYEFTAGGMDSPSDGDRDEITDQECAGYLSGGRFLRMELVDPIESLRIEIDTDLEATFYINGPVHRCNVKNVEFFPAEAGIFNIHVTMPEEGREESVNVVFRTNF